MLNLVVTIVASIGMMGIIASVIYLIPEMIKNYRQTKEILETVKDIQSVVRNDSLFLKYKSEDFDKKTSNLISLTNSKTEEILYEVKKYTSAQRISHMTTDDLLDYAKVVTAKITENELLKQNYSQLIHENEELRQIVDQLQDQYENSVR